MEADKTDREGWPGLFPVEEVAEEAGNWMAELEETTTATAAEEEDRSGVRQWGGSEGLRTTPRRPAMA